MWEWQTAWVWLIIYLLQVLHNLSLWSATDEPDAGVKVGVAKGMMTHKLKLKVSSEAVTRDGGTC